ncbi:MAG: hypothetical protein HY221_01275 [Candidatus Sungbacteria bacterium]|uniref:Anticodon-binding domain-containing protein n=1 Tax=Candidatus Sungiibacteriota bacterium TaxID=2750080 RepID=A0A932R1G5_9BACT|nr:hypothetical protein [Candidatus Sungbacteria bacterium]
MLYDERDDKTAGEKFADADLVGIPWRIVVSDKTVVKKGVELKARRAPAGRVVSESEALKKIAESCKS